MSEEISQITVVVDGYTDRGVPFRRVLPLEQAEVYTDYDIDFRRYGVMAKGYIPRDNNPSADIPQHPADKTKEVTNGTEEVILAEIVED